MTFYAILLIFIIINQHQIKHDTNIIMALLLFSHIHKIIVSAEDPKFTTTQCQAGIDKVDIEDQECCQLQGMSDAAELCKPIISSTLYKPESRVYSLYVSSSGVKVPINNEMIFSTSMSEEHFLKWLKSRGVSERDCKTLIGRIDKF